MSKITKTEMKANLKALKAAAQMADRLREEAQAAEELYEKLRLETMRKVEMYKLAKSTQLVFNGRILNVKSYGYSHVIKENGVITHDNFRADSVHGVRIALATGQI